MHLSPSDLGSNTFFQIQIQIRVSEFIQIQIQIQIRHPEIIQIQIQIQWIKYKYKYSMFYFGWCGLSLALKRPCHMELESCVTSHFLKQYLQTWFLLNISSLSNEKDRGVTCLKFYYKRLWLALSLVTKCCADSSNIWIFQD